jgi:2-polyprenyl-6-hydroxyphenyl methylase/3-demethylubiquinone-9 3-methyltransferase
MLNEVEKFDRFGKNWWNTESGEFKLLHKINPLRIEFIKTNLTNHYGAVSGLKILDIGCGGGLATIPMAKLGAEVTGIDPSSQAVIAANNKATELGLSNASHICTMPEFFTEPERSFDAILCLDVVEHVENLEIFAGCVAKFLKPDGAVIISTINKTPKSFLQAIVAAEYILKMLPKGTHSYDKFVKPSNLQQEFSKHNISIKKLTGIGLSIMKQKWEFVNQIDVNYLAYLAHNSI